MTDERASPWLGHKTLPRSIEIIDRRLENRLHRDPSTCHTSNEDPPGNDQTPGDATDR
jgi:hypothetical protein